MSVFIIQSTVSGVPRHRRVISSLSPGSSVLVDGYFEGSLTDVALLHVSDFYVDEAKQIETWHTLVHVCQKWREVVLGSPHRPNLCLWAPAPQNVCEGDAGHLATLAHRRMGHGYETGRVDNIRVGTKIGK